MSADPVHVLAILDGDIFGMEEVLPKARGSDRDALVLGIQNMREARAAVADLVDAAKGARRYLRELADAGFGDDTPIKPLDVALARIGGAA